MKYGSGEYIPENPEKYIGTYPIQLRSSWEWSLAILMDKNPGCLGWSSESISIPYKNPLTGKWAMYVPDFFAIFVDNKGNKRAEMIEVKPLKETPGFTGKCTQRDKLAQAINAAKWTAALQYCIKRGWTFHPITEREINNFTRRK